MIPTLLGAVTLIFLLMRLLPGDVALYILGSGESSDVNKQALQQIREELGLDQPLIVQYGKWLWGAAQVVAAAGAWTSSSTRYDASKMVKTPLASVVATREPS